ncbi:MAG: bactofilin family protein [Syntrophobacteria bacterium]|jgi:cytoskeletal protein CcmA (bactofilin family)
MRAKTKDKDITIISEKSDIEGKLKMPGKVMILGSFTGSINCSTLEIFMDGKVVGSIEAENVIIAGYVEGELACSGLLTIAKTGTVKGRVAYGNLSVELGGLLDAEVFQLESRDTKLVPFHPKGVHSDT